MSQIHMIRLKCDHCEKESEPFDGSTNDNFMPDGWIAVTFQGVEFSIAANRGEQVFGTPYIRAVGRCKQQSRIQPRHACSRTHALALVTHATAEALEDMEKSFRQVKARINE